MTVTRETTIARFIGATADAKPTGVEVGSTYLDYQTGILYTTYDGTNWVAAGGETVTLAAGTNLIGKVGIDQATANANDVVVKSITAGETHIGKVSGNGKSVLVPLTVTNGAYTIKDVVGGLITLTGAVRANGGHAIINSIKLGGVAAIAYNLHFLNADLATPAADNAAYTLAAADLPKLLGYVQIGAGDYLSDASAGFNAATVKNVGLQVKAAAATTSIYAYLVATAVTSPGTTTLQLVVDSEYLD